MKVRTYGFTFDKFLFPSAMTRPSLFEYLGANPGVRIGTSYQLGSAKVTLPCGAKTQDWWGGMLLRIRDSKGYLKLTEKGGKSVLTAESLGEGERLAEVSFLLAHPETGNGLITHHYHATSIYSFGRVCERVFATHRRNLRNDALAVAGLTGKQKKAVRGSYEGKLSLGQLCLETKLKDLVKKLQRVNAFDFKFTTVTTKETFLKGIAERAESERVKFMFPPDADVDALADEIDLAVKGEGVAELKVHGVDVHGTPREYTMDQNPQVFDEYDYDDMMKGLKLDLSDWGNSIKNSAAIAHLGKVAAGHTVMQLLTKA